MTVNAEVEFCVQISAKGWEIPFSSCSARPGEKRK